MKKTYRLTLDFEMEVPTNMQLAEWEAERGYRCATSYMAAKDSPSRDEPLTDAFMHDFIENTLPDVVKIGLQGTKDPIITFIDIKKVR